MADWSDDEFGVYDAAEGSRYPVHDCVEFEDADSLRVSSLGSSIKGSWYNVYETSRRGCLLSREITLFTCTGKISNYCQVRRISRYRTVVDLTRARVYIETCTMTLYRCK